MEDLGMGARVSRWLQDDGWNVTAGGLGYMKRIPGFAEPGALSDGTRMVRLELCSRGRYLARMDGWGNVLRDVDLRDFDSPEAAVAATLEGPRA